MEVAKIKITGADASVSELKAITSGMIGATVAIEYDDTWSELNKQVVFRTVFRTVNAEGTTIPPEVLRTAGSKLEVGVYGYTDDGAVAIPTVWASLGMVRKGADPEGDQTAKPTLPLWAQLQNQIGSLDELSTETKESLVAAINELVAMGSDREIPTFDLTEMGMPDIPMTATLVYANRDMAELRAAMVEGPVRLKFQLIQGSSTAPMEGIFTAAYSVQDDTYEATLTGLFNNHIWNISIFVYPDFMGAVAAELTVSAT